MKHILVLFFVFSNLVGEVIEIDLSTSEKGLYSSHGEDGIIARIFQWIPPTSRYVVEFSAGDGITHSNSYLLRLQGWNCILMDRSHEILEYKLFNEFVTADNINQLFDKYKVPQEFDLLCIDNYNEFYIWQNLHPKYKPKVVSIKYNATHLPHEDKVAKYKPYFCGDDTNYFGASILAMYNLGKMKGYSLVYAENVGVKLFFIRNDVLQESGLQFKNVNDVDKVYRYPAYGKGPNGGHREDAKHRPYLSSAEILSPFLSSSENLDSSRQSPSNLKIYSARKRDHQWVEEICFLKQMESYRCGY